MISRICAILWARKLVGCPTPLHTLTVVSSAGGMLRSPIMIDREPISRRDAITRLAGAGIASARLSAQTNSAPQIPSWTTELRQLAPNVYAYTQASGPGVDNAILSNAGVIVGDDLLAIDALGPPVHAKAFIAAAKQATGKPFGRLVNTHHHRDHTNGNCFFLPAEIVGHEFSDDQDRLIGRPSEPCRDGAGSTAEVDEPSINRVGRDRREFRALSQEKMGKP